MIYGRGTAAKRNGSWQRNVLRRRVDSGIFLTALTIAAEGGEADIAKPLHGLGSGVLEISLGFRGDAFRVIYALQVGEEIWVVHAFQKKSKQGIKTPRHEIDLVKDRLKRLKEALQ